MRLLQQPKASCSDDRAVVEKMFERLLDDFVAEEKAAHNSLIAKLHRSSPFTTRVMREVVLLLTMPMANCTGSDRRALVVMYANHIFSSWG